MLGFAPLTTAPLSDDANRLPLIVVGAGGASAENASRAINFALHSLCEVELSAKSSAGFSVTLVASVGADGAAKSGSALALTGGAAAAADVASSSQGGFVVSGGSSGEAQILSVAVGELTTASAGDAEAFVVVSADRTVRLGGSVQAEALADAAATDGGLEFALLSTGKTKPASEASGSIPIEGAGACAAAANASASGDFAVTRTGAGDVSITGQSERVITFLGSSSLKVACLSAANSRSEFVTDARAAALVDASVVQSLGGFVGESVATVRGQSVAADGFWPITGASLAFLAAPSLRRGAFPSESQGGGLINGRRSSAA